MWKWMTFFSPVISLICFVIPKVFGRKMPEDPRKCSETTAVEVATVHIRHKNNPTKSGPQITPPTPIFPPSHKNRPCEKRPLTWQIDNRNCKIAWKIKNIGIKVPSEETPVRAFGRKATITSTEEQQDWVFYGERYVQVPSSSSISIWICSVYEVSQLRVHENSKKHSILRTKKHNLWKSKISKHLFCLSERTIAEQANPKQNR